MSIPINKFINVDFKIIQKSPTIGSYKTVVYVIPDSFKVDSETVQMTLCSKYEVSSDKTLKVYNDKGTEITELSSEIKENIRTYFNNGGVRLLLLKPTQYTNDAFLNDLEKARTIASDFIYVVINNTICDSSSGFTHEVLKEIAKTLDTYTSPYTTRLLLTKNLINEGTIDYTYIDDFKNYNVGIKFCSKKINGKVLDAALLIGAYFSKVNLDNYQSIKDYCYTEETLLNSSGEEDSAENVSGEEYENLVAKNYNFIDKTSKFTVNFGGNLANGVSLHTDFGTICVENDICFATLDTIMGKQYLNESGLTNVVATINSQLQRYKNNGYLHTNTNYSGEDLNIEYDNTSYRVIDKGSTLPQGFYIFTIPISQISALDKLEKRFTPIYVVMETLYGARTVTIQGEVR